jgi:hypothetical protein
MPPAEPPPASEPGPPAEANPLDLPSTPPPARPARSTELELPDEPARPEPTAPTDAPTEPVAADPGPLGNLVADHFRRVEVAMLGRVLITTLAGALPASMVRVQRRRSLGQRLGGRPGQPIGITVTARDRTLSFRSPEVGVSEATVGHAVRGVVLSTTPVPIAQWLDELASLLNEVAHDDEAARLALERAFVRP